MLVVSSETPESIPPKTPAIHISFSVLQIIKSFSDNSLSTSSREVNLVLSLTVLTITLLPTILAASNACNGWPVSCNTKLVTSTTLFIGVNPILNNLFFNQSGDSFTSIPLIVTPE